MKRALLERMLGLAIPEDLALSLCQQVTLLPDACTRVSATLIRLSPTAWGSFSFAKCTACYLVTIPSKSHPSVCQHQPLEAACQPTYIRS